MNFVAVFSGSSEDVRRRASPSPQGFGASFPHPMSPVPDSEALITLDIEIISPNSADNPPGECGLQIANIQFNNLDVIGMKCLIYRFADIFMLCQH